MPPFGSSGYIPPTTPALASTSGGLILTTAAKMAGGDPSAVAAYAEQVIKAHAVRIVELANELSEIRDRLGQSWSSGIVSANAGQALDSGVRQFTTNSDRAIKATDTINAGANLLDAIQSGFSTIATAAEPIVAALLSNPFTSGAGEAYGATTSGVLSAVTETLENLISKIASTALQSFVTEMVGEGVRALLADDQPTVPTLSSYPSTNGILPSGLLPTSAPVGTTYPGTTYPGTTYPGATYPGATYPGTTYPGTTYPGTTYPGATYPGATYPSAIQPTADIAPGVPNWAGTPPSPMATPGAYGSMLAGYGNDALQPPRYMGDGQGAGLAPWTPSGATNQMPPWLDNAQVQEPPFSQSPTGGQPTHDTHLAGGNQAGQHGHHGLQGNGDHKGHGGHQGAGDHKGHGGHQGHQGHGGHHAGGTDVTIESGNEHVTIHVDGNDPTTVHTHLGGPRGADFDISVDPRHS